MRTLRPVTDRPDGSAPAVPSSAEVPLVVHIIYRLGTGGLENGLINLLNHMPAGRYRHAIWCLKGYDAFRERLTAPNVEVVDLGKREGKDLAIYARVWRHFRRQQPSIVHLRNLGTIDFAWIASLAGVPHVIQGEHGWDMLDLHGRVTKYRLLRQLCRPFIDRYITVSKNLTEWLAATVRVPRERIVRICNGVDLDRFHPAPTAEAMPREFVFGWVGRMAEVKAPTVLVKAFINLVATRPEQPLRLLLVGEGPLQDELRALVDAADLDAQVWMVGHRNDIAEWLRRIDVFVLPSLNEGISNTILEAMATGLPVIASNVGGNPELIVEGVTGTLVPPNDPVALASAMRRYVESPGLISGQGCAARARAESEFSLVTMVADYMRVYDEVLAGSRIRTGALEDQS